MANFFRQRHSGLKTLSEKSVRCLASATPLLIQEFPIATKERRSRHVLPNLEGRFQPPNQGSRHSKTQVSLTLQFLGGMGLQRGEREREREKEHAQVRRPKEVFGVGFSRRVCQNWIMVVNFLLNYNCNPGSPRGSFFYKPGLRQRDGVGGAP